MKIQKSRNSRQPVKDYSSVCHQQGRMLTDSDLTEQALISRDRLNEALKDVIGSGTPRHGALLQVTESSGARIPSLHWGRVYVDGILGEVRADAEAPDDDQFGYTHQHYYPDAPALPESDYRLYVDLWERSVTWIEDEMLRDPGLHGADTTTRTQTTAQVKWCDSAIDPLCSDVNPTIGDARVRLVLRSLATSTDPCDPCADELKLNDPVGNYLFRVEVHDVSYDENNQPAAMVLKWSSENGAEAYATADVPPDFSNSQFVYEFFDETSEKQLGVHLGRDSSNQRIIDGRRQPLVNEFSDSSPLAKKFVRRWDGWCQIEKSGPDWQLTKGFEGTIDLTRGVGADKPGHVVQGGGSVGIELRVISMDIELADYSLVAGDYWIAPVRESIHQQGDVLLEDEAGGEGVPPTGEPHHYLLLVDVAADGTLSLPEGSDCDSYNACQPFQFPALTDLRADDICFDNTSCELPQVNTVQDALDRLCQERDLRWHNKHLHGWGVVCGLELECDAGDPTKVVLKSGYALDCEGNDMVVGEDGLSINIPKRLEEEQIDPGTLDENQGVCLYLEHTRKGELDVGIELYESDNNKGFDRLRDTLLYDFYDKCIRDLIETLTGELQRGDVQARCALTRCGQELIRPVQRRALTLANIMFQYQQGDSTTVLNISHCEHALLNDLYDKLKDLLRSRTFCAQFQNADFPDYPFADDKLCRATWFTPEPLDHIRLHPSGKLAFGWKRSSSRVFVFEQLDNGCRGDLVGYFDVPQLDNGSISDLTINVDDRENTQIYIAGIIHNEDTLFAGGQFPDIARGGCEIKIDWNTSFICGVKIVQLKQSPWSSELYAVGLCRGVYLFKPEDLFKDTKIERDPDWDFPASGHIDFDVNGAQIVCTAAEEETNAEEKAECSKGEYNRLVIIKMRLRARTLSQPVLMLTPTINQRAVTGSDGFVLARGVGIGREEIESTHVTHESNFTALGNNLVLFLVADNGDKKVLCHFDSANLQSDEKNDVRWYGRTYHQFGAASHIALQYVKGGKLDGVVATRYAMHDMQYIPGNTHQYDNGVLNSIPVQAGPVDIVVSDELQQVHALNHLGQSITVLNYELQVYQEKRQTLQQYRTNVIDAFYQLLSGLLQYLKDCFCNHLLIHCPECDENDKVYLGCLSLRDGEVYNICNFTKRKYVKTFSSISYWLSLIPIGPLVTWAIEQFCCMVLPNLFQKKGVQRFALSPKQLGLASAVMNTDHANLMKTISVAGMDIGRKGLSELVKAGYKDSSSYEDLAGSEYHYKPGVIRIKEPVITTNEAVREKIDDIELDRAKTKDKVTELEHEVVILKQEKGVAEERYKALEDEYNNVLVKRVEAVEADKQAAETEVASLKEKLAKLQQEKSASDQRFSKLEKDILELNKLRSDIQPIITGAQPVSSIAGITANHVRILEANNINTISRLAETDANKLKELGIQTNTATSLIRKAKSMTVITR